VKFAAHLPDREDIQIAGFPQPIGRQETQHIRLGNQGGAQRFERARQIPGQGEIEAVIPLGQIGQRQDRHPLGPQGRCPAEQKERHQYSKALPG